MDKLLKFLFEVILLLKPDLKKWLVRTLITFGLGLISQPVWEPYLQATLSKYFQFNVPDSSNAGWALLILGLLFHMLHLRLENSAKPNEIITATAGLNLDFQNIHPYTYTEPADATGLAIRGFRVSVTNNGAADINNCIVYLHKITSATDPNFVNAFTPIPLITQQKRLQGRRGGEFNLRVGQTKYVDVVRLDERKDDAQIILQYADSETPNMVVIDEYILEIVAYGGGLPAKCKFKLLVDNDNFLRFEKFVPQAEEKPWREEIVMVDFNWPVASGFQKKMESRGYKLKWTRPDLVHNRLADGYEVVFDINEQSRVKRQIQLKDDSVLLGKKA